MLPFSWIEKSKVNTTTIGNASEKCEHLSQKYKDRSDTAVSIWLCCVCARALVYETDDRVSHQNPNLIVEKLSKCYNAYTPL